MAPVAEVDIIPAVVTFAACLLLRLELGIVVGIAVNLLFLLYASARPAVRISSALVRTPHISPHSPHVHLYQNRCQ